MKLIVDFGYKTPNPDRFLLGLHKKYNRLYEKGATDKLRKLGEQGTDITFPLAISNSPLKVVTGTSKGKKVAKGIISEAKGMDGLYKANYVGHPKYSDSIKDAFKTFDPNKNYSITGLSDKHSDVYKKVLRKLNMNNVEVK